VKPIPAIWRIDIEPDEFQPGPGLPPWTGFVAMADLVAQLRGPLADLSGTAVQPSWFLRLDPDIERAYGRADFVVEQYGSLIDELRAHGDPLGIHVHFYRWDEKRQVSFSDHADEGWTSHCLDVATSTFERCFGERPRRSSQGGFFLSESVVDRAIAAGIEVDVTAEPGLPAQSEGTTFGAYATAPSPDFSGFPRFPYYPSQGNLARPASSAADGRPLMIVPLTSYDYERAFASLRIRLIKAVLRWPSRHRPLNPYKSWPSPHAYWDLVERAADEGPANYVAIAVRTDHAQSQSYIRSRPLFEYLPKHPIARRLRFVDPVSPEIRALADAHVGQRSS